MAGGLAAALGNAAEGVTFGVMLAVFLAAAIRRRWPIGIALVVAAWAGAALNGSILPARHLVEGAFSYLDPILVIATAMILMRMLADGGALGSAVSVVERRFGARPSLLLPLLMLLVMFPGMITGSSTASVLTTGAVAAPLLARLGLSRERAGAFVAMGGVLGMVAPPINIPAMLIGGGIDLPYVGFEVPLAIASFPAALLIAYWLGWPIARGAGHTSVQEQAADVAGAVRAAPPRAALWRATLPVLVAAGLMAGPRLWPARIPDVGLPLVFLIAAFVAAAVLPRFRVGASLVSAVEESLPVLAILTGVGGFIQVMTLTGARGWIVALMLAAPPWALIAAAAVGLPLFGAVSAFGSASVLGVPFLLARLGGHEVVTTSGLSLLAGVGDLMLPAAVAATLAAQVAGVADRRLVLRRCIGPALLCIAAGVLMLVFAPELGRWSKGL